MELCLHYSHPSELLAVIVTLGSAFFPFLALLLLYKQ